MKFSRAHISYVFMIFLTNIIRFGVIMPATLNSKTDQRLMIAAIQNKNILDMLEEFTSNWSGNKDRVAEQQDKQLSQISGSKYYSISTESSSFTTGMSENSMRNAMSLLLVSSNFKTSFNNNLDRGCKFYQSDEFVFNRQNVLIYSKLSYMAYDPSNSDRFAMAFIQYGVKLDRITEDVERFLACISESSENSCTLPKKWTEQMWSSFVDWIKEAAIVVFMENNQQRYDQIRSHLRDIGSYLPKDFRSTRMCCD